MKDQHRAPWRLITIGVICAAGIALRVAQLANRGNLWLDEAMLAQSIVDRPATGLLFTPLEYYQLSPPGFLQLAKLGTKLISPLEVALRMPSTVFAIAALLLFALLSWRHLRKLEPVFAVILFAFGPLIIAYSAETKQYAGDLFFALSISFAALELRASAYSRKWLRISAVLGVVAVWFSDTASIVLVGVGAALGLIAWLEGDRKARRPALTLGSAWSVALIAAQLGAFSRAGGGTAAVMRSYWKEHFFPIPVSVESASWLPRALDQIYTDSLGLRTLGGVTLLIASAGMVALWRRGNRDIVAIFFAPVLVTLAASLARLYPFTGRLTLFLLPAFILAVSAGMVYVGSFAKRWAPVAQVVVLLLLVSPPRMAAAANPLPWRKQEIAPVIEHVARNRASGDKIYVYWGGIPATLFYGRRYGITYDDITPGILSKDPKDIMPDVSKLRGSPRVWVVFSHDLVPGLREKVIHHLDSIGSRYPASGDSAHGVHAYLYDLAAPK